MTQQDRGETNGHFSCSPAFWRRAFCSRTHSFFSRPVRWEPGRWDCKHVMQSSPLPGCLDTSTSQRGTKTKTAGKKNTTAAATKPKVQKTKHPHILLFTARLHEERHGQTPDGKKERNKSIPTGPIQTHSPPLYLLQKNISQLGWSWQKVVHSYSKMELPKYAALPFS